MRKVAYFLIFLFLIPVLGATDVRAESDIALEDAGITMVALRNDTLDLNQDGDVDAVPNKLDHADVEDDGCDGVHAHDVGDGHDGHDDRT